MTRSRRWAPVAYFYDVHFSTFFVDLSRRPVHRHGAAQADLGALKPGLGIERATDVLFLLAGHDPYRSLVQDAGWPIVEYRSWLFVTLVQQLLGDTAIEPEAVADVSFRGSGVTAEHAADHRWPGRQPHPERRTGRCPCVA